VAVKSGTTNKTPASRASGQTFPWRDVSTVKPENITTKRISTQLRDSKSSVTSGLPRADRRARGSRISQNPLIFSPKSLLQISLIFCTTRKSRETGEKAGIRSTPPIYLRLLLQRRRDLGVLDHCNGFLVDEIGPCDC
jgi:hypothetical protein